MEEEDVLLAALSENCGKNLENNWVSHVCSKINTTELKTNFYVVESCCHLCDGVSRVFGLPLFYSRPNQLDWEKTTAVDWIPIKSHGRKIKHQISWKFRIARQFVYILGSIQIKSLNLNKFHSAALDLMRFLRSSVMFTLPSAAWVVAASVYTLQQLRGEFQ